MNPIREVVSVELVSAYRLQLRFDDGVEGEVDVEQLVPFRGVFAAIKAPDVFAQVQVEPELGTIGWPNGADLDPLVLYSCITGKALPGAGDGRSAGAA